MRGAAALCAATLALAGCGSQPQPQPSTKASTAAPAIAPAPASSTPIAAPAEPAPAGAAAEADKGEAGARAVLTQWAHALERGDFDAAYGAWGAEAHRRSGMDAGEHTQWWARFKTITVALQPGQMEGAAGSSYYAAPVAFVGKQRSGKPYRLEGTVTLRRVNDVPGATPDQLRWHLEKVELQPVS